MPELDFRQVSRYAEIISVIFRHGFGFLITDQLSFPSFFPANNIFYGNRTDFRILGKHLREALTELGPTFIKLGQLASTRSDIIPKPIIEEIEKLQDTVPPFSFNEVRYIIERELGTSLNHIFSSFRDIPIASASIGQVHYAILKNGKPVAVKIQRPYIDSIIELDLMIFEDLINLTEKKFSEIIKKYFLRNLFMEFSDSIKKELNYNNEAKNCEKMAKNFRKNSSCHFPKVYTNLTTEKVLTTEYIEGIKINQRELFIENGYNLQIITDKFSHAMIEQIIVYGYFHGDPHPGNVLVTPDNKIAFLDFGIVGNLTPHLKYCLVVLLRAITKKSTKDMVKGISKIGVVPSDADLNALTQDLDRMRRKHLEGPMNKISLAHSINDFITILQVHRIQIPLDLMLVGKSLITLDGIVRTLDPEYNFLEAVKPYGKFFIKDYLKILRPFKLRLKTF